MGILLQLELVRVIAMIEALIGYTIPAAFVARASLSERNEVILCLILRYWNKLICS